MHARARELLRRVPYAAIATTDGRRPWNSPVAIGHDEQWNFFWISSSEAVHSRNVRATGRAFLAIFNSAAFLGTGPAAGIYLECAAVELADEADVRHGMEALTTSMRRTSAAPPEKALGASPLRVYRATPERAWMNDIVEQDGFRYDTRTELDLSRIDEPD